MLSVSLAASLERKEEKDPMQRIRMHVCKQVYTSKIANTVTGKEAKKTKTDFTMSSSPKRLQEWPRGRRGTSRESVFAQEQSPEDRKDSETPRAVGLFSTAPNAAAAGKFCVCNSGAGS